MCLFNNRSDIVTPSNTILLAGRYQKAGTIRHYLGYYNQSMNTPLAAFKPRDPRDVFDRGELAEDETAYQKALRENLRPFGFHAASGIATTGNAMLIPFPAVPMTRPGEIEIIPLGDEPGLLGNYAQAVTTNREATSSLSLSKNDCRAVQVIKGFDGGRYDVVYSPNANWINDAVRHNVDKEKQPCLNPDFYRQLELLYPRWSWLVFCFSQREPQRAGGALVNYVSQYPDLLFLPGLTGYSGKLEENRVSTDHTIILGAENFPNGAASASVEESEWMRANAPWLPRKVIGCKINRTMPQGDFLFDAREVEKGIFNGLRDQPPGWQNLFGPNSIDPEPYMFGDRRWNSTNPEHFV